MVANHPFHSLAEREREHDLSQKNVIIESIIKFFFFFRLFFGMCANENAGKRE
jgi:hypothetical protein